MPLVRLQRHRTELICKVAGVRGHLLRLSGKITHIRWVVIAGWSGSLHRVVTPQALLTLLVAVSSTRTGISTSTGEAAAEARSLLLGIILRLIPWLVSRVLLVQGAHRISVSGLLGERMLSRRIRVHMLVPTVVPVWVVGLLLHTWSVLCRSVGVAVGTHSKVIAAGKPVRYFLKV